MVSLALAISLAAPAHILAAADEAKVLSQKLGLRVEVSRELQRDLLFVDERDAAPRTLLKAVAIALGASVRADKVGVILSRTAADSDALRTHVTDVRMSWIQQHLDRLTKYRSRALAGKSLIRGFLDQATLRQGEYAALTSGKGTSLDPFEPEQLLPTEELLEGILKRVGYRKLAGLPPSEVRLYTDSPTGSAERLPPIADLLAIYEANMKALGSATIDPARLRDLGAYQRQELDSLQRSVPIEDVRVTERSGDLGLTFVLEGFGSEGSRVARATFEAGPQEVVLTPKTWVAEAKSRPDAVWAQLSPDGAQAVSFATGQALGEPPPFWYDHPDKLEPLSLYVAGALYSLAEEDGHRPFVFEVSDSLWQLVAQCCVDGKLSVDALNRTIQSYTSYERLDEGGIAVWRTFNPELDEHERADRSALSQFAKELTATDGYSEPRTAAGLYHGASLTIAPLAQAWQVYGPANRGHNAVASSLGDGVIRALGCLSQDNWKMLDAGHTIRISDSALQGELADALRDSWGWKVQSNRVVPERSQDPVALYTLSEPFELTLTVSAELPETFAYWWSPKQKEQPPTLPTEQMVKQYFSGIRSFFDADAPTPVLTKTREEIESMYSGYRFRQGRWPRLNLRIDLPGGTYVTGLVTGSPIPVSGILSYSQLPQEMRDAMWNYGYEEGYAAAKAIHSQPPGNGIAGGSKSVTPP